MQSLRNFFITLGISLVVFGLIAWLIWGSIVPDDKAAVKDPVIKEEDEQVMSVPENDEDEVIGDSFTAVLCCYDDYIGRADSILLVTVDKNTEKFSICPIPSYLYIDLGTENVKKQAYLGDLLIKNGKNFFLQKIEALTGVSIDYYAFMSNADFVRIINEIGGIEYTVPINMYYRNAEGSELVNLKAGTSRLMGEEALQLLRFRGYPAQQGITDDGDAVRRKTQCQFIYKMFGTFLKPENKESIEGIVKTLLELISDGETNFTLTAFIRHKDLILKYGDFKHETIEYPILKTTVETLANNEVIAVHTPDIDRAVEHVFSEFNND